MRFSKGKYWGFLFFVASLVFLSSCSISKVLPEGKKLYTGYDIEIKTDSSKISTKKLATKLEKIKLNPQTNKKFFWTYMRLRLYSWFSNGKEKGLVASLRKKIGEPPVIFEVEDVLKNISVIKNVARNNGHFYATVDTVLHISKHRAYVSYLPKVSRPYRLENIENIIADSTVIAIISARQKKTLIDSSDVYELDQLELERKRLATLMKQKGYFYFQDDFFLFQADSTDGDRKIKLRLKLKEGVPEKAKQPQSIHKIFVYPNYDFKKGINRSLDSLEQDGLVFIADNSTFSPTFLRDVIPINIGDTYSPKAHSRLIARLSNINAFKFVNVDYSEHPQQDSLLNLHIYITPFVRHGVTGEVGLAIRSNTFIGPEFSFTYTNRNLFKNAEELKVSIKSSFNFPLRTNTVAYSENGGKASIAKPGLLIPFSKNGWSKKIENASTSFSLSFNRQATTIPIDTSDLTSLDTLGLNQLAQFIREREKYRFKFGVSRIETGLTYNWTRNKILSHSYTPVKVNFIIPSFALDQLSDYLLLNGGNNSDVVNLERSLLLDAKYSIALQTPDKKTNRHRFYNRTTTSFGLNKLLPFSDPREDRNILESRYIKLENDFRYYYRLAEGQVVAFRFGIMSAIPLQKGDIIPSLELYHAGGANDVRAFQSNSVGPGSSLPGNPVNSFTGLGDFKLVSSLEFRSKVYDFLELGYFIDAGNVWTNFGANPVDNLLKELAVGAGLGVRLDFDIILVRLDFALPFTKPWQPNGRYQVGRDWYAVDGLVPDKWARKWMGDLTFHFVIGYPF